MLHKFRTATSLSASDWLILLDAWWILLRIRVVLTVVPFARWRDRFLQAANQETSPPDEQQWRLCRRCSQMLTLACRYHIVSLRCLHKSMALQQLLEKRAVHTCLRIGIRKEDAELEGHAWLEIGSRVINDSPDVAARYVLLSGLSPQLLNMPKIS